MKKTILSILFIALVGFAFAGNDNNKGNKTNSEAPALLSVSGNVVDMHTGEALTGVEISIEGTDVKTYTDFDGNFVLTNLTPGEYDFVASYISYKKSLVENFKTGGEKSVSIKLQAD